MGTFYRHPGFLDVVMEITGPVKRYGGGNVEFPVTWWMKRWKAPWRKDKVSIPPQMWETFRNTCMERGVVGPHDAPNLFD